MKRLWLALGALALPGVVGLAVGLAPRGERVEPGTQPPSIRYGEDLCDACLMHVSERRFAAAYETPAGEVRRFDDVGDLLAFRRTRAEDVAATWVHDLPTQEWVRAERARFVVAPDVVTPMGSGIVAFAAPRDAAAFAAVNGGRVRTFGELLAEAVGGAP